MPVSTGALASGVCAKCGAEFSWPCGGRGRPRKYCDGCRRVDVRRRPSGYVPVVHEPRKCSVCEQVFQPTNRSQVYCSKPCGDRGKPSAAGLACAVCGGPMARGRTSAAPGQAAHNRCKSAQHNASRYRQGCRCDDCREAMVSWNREYRKRREAEGRPVPAGGRWIEPRQRVAIYERDGWRCHLCNELVDPCADPNSKWYPTLDHLEPRSRGGSDDALNLRIAHRYCNAVRQDRPLEAMSYVSVEGG